MGIDTTEPQLNVLSRQVLFFFSFNSWLAKNIHHEKKEKSNRSSIKFRKTGTIRAFFLNAVCIRPLSFHFPYIHSSSSYAMRCNAMYRGPEVMRKPYSFFLNYWTSRKKKYDSDLLSHLPLLLEFSLLLSEAQFVILNTLRSFISFSPPFHTWCLCHSPRQSWKLDTNTVFGAPVVVAGALFLFLFYFKTTVFFPRKLGTFRYTLITPDPLVRSRSCTFFLPRPDWKRWEARCHQKALENRSWEMKTNDSFTLPYSPWYFHLISGMYFITLSTSFVI